MKPVLQALILAQQIYETTDGGKIICGTFNAVALEKQNTESGGDRDHNKQLRGGVPGSPSAYISLTDVVDGTKILLQFVSLKRNLVIFETGMTLRCDNRLATLEIICRLPMLPISEPGVYAFEIVCEGDILGSSRIRAIESDENER